jgi:hypothetical protein
LGKRFLTKEAPPENGFLGGKPGGPPSLRPEAPSHEHGAMMSKSRGDQNHWRARAEAARVHAQQMIEPVTKGMMVEVAEYYESLARGKDCSKLKN